MAVWHKILDPDKLEGTKNGFHYKFIQVMANDKLLFTLTTPTGVSHWVEVYRTEQVELLTKEPHKFYLKYIAE